MFCNKLTKYIFNSDDSWKSGSYTFRYDEQGRLIEAIETFGNESTYQFTWGDDTIDITEKEESLYVNTYTYKLTLKDGLVQNVDGGDDYTFTYNSSNRLESEKYSSEYSESYVWDNDKLMSFDDYYKFTYGTTCKKGYCPLFPHLLKTGNTPVLYVAHPELAGLRTTQLPHSMFVGSSDYSEFTYEFDSEGYISKIIETGADYTNTTILLWE